MRPGAAGHRDARRVLCAAARAAARRARGAHGVRSRSAAAPLRARGAYRRRRAAVQPASRPHRRNPGALRRAAPAAQDRRGLRSPHDRHAGIERAVRSRRGAAAGADRVPHGHVPGVRAGASPRSPASTSTACARWRSRRRASALSAPGRHRGGPGRGPPRTLGRGLRSLRADAVRRDDRRRRRPRRCSSSGYYERLHDSLLPGIEDVRLPIRLQLGSRSWSCPTPAPGAELHAIVRLPRSRGGAGGVRARPEGGAAHDARSDGRPSSSSGRCRTSIWRGRCSRTPRCRTRRWTRCRWRRSRLPRRSISCSARSRRTSRAARWWSCCGVRTSRSRRTIGSLDARGRARARSLPGRSEVPRDAERLSSLLGTAPPRSAPRHALRGGGRRGARAAGRGAGADGAGADRRHPRVHRRRASASRTRRTSGSPRHLRARAAVLAALQTLGTRTRRMIRRRCRSRSCPARCGDGSTGRPSRRASAPPA